MPLDPHAIKSCRICLVTNNSDCVSLDDDSEIMDMYKFCCGLNLSTEDTPRLLCSKCVQKLKDFSKFKSQSQKSDTLWKKIIRTDVSECPEESVSKDIVFNDFKSECQDICNIGSSDNETDIEFTKTNSIKENNEDLDLILEVVDERKSTTEVTNENDFKIKERKKTYTCDRCKVEYRVLRYYEKHLSKNNCLEPGAVNEARKFYCGLCKMYSSDPVEVRDHINEHAEKDDLFCKLCEFIGSDFADMVTHRYTHQPNYEYKMYVCPGCGQRCHMLLALQFHYRTVHLKKEKGGVCTVCNKEFRKYKSWRNHERLHEEVNYICDCCNKNFLYRHSIEEHLKDRAGHRPYVCDLCGKSFKRNRNLTLHLRTVHDTTQVTCTHCNVIFKNQKSLEYHLRFERKGKQYQCDICSKCFYTDYQLRSHMVWHYNDRPYACDVCKATFKTRPSLKIHMRKHSGIKPYKCTLCPKEFTQLNQLKVHFSVHTGLRRYKCPYCERSYHNKKHLVQHCDKAHHVTDFQITVPKKEIEN